MPNKPPKISNSTQRARASTRTEMNPREKRFVAEYLRKMEGKAAAIAAGYSARSADKIAHELLQRPVVKAALGAALDKQESRTLIDADEVLLSIQRVGLAAEASTEYSAALRAYELLGKRYKLFADKVEHSGPEGGPIAFQRIERTVVDPK